MTKHATSVLKCLTLVVKERRHILHDILHNNLAKLVGDYYDI